MAPPKTTTLISFTSLRETIVNTLMWVERAPKRENIQLQSAKTRPFSLPLGLPKMFPTIYSSKKLSSIWNRELAFVFSVPRFPKRTRSPYEIILPHTIWDLGEVCRRPSTYTKFSQGAHTVLPINKSNFCLYNKIVCIVTSAPSTCHSNIMRLYGNEISLWRAWKFLVGRATVWCSITEIKMAYRLGFSFCGRLYN